MPCFPRLVASQSSMRMAYRSASCQRPSRQNFCARRPRGYSRISRRPASSPDSWYGPRCGAGPARRRRTGCGRGALRRVAAAPGRPLADKQAASRPAVAPVDPASPMKPMCLSVSSRIAQAKSVPRLGLDLLEKQLLLAAADTQVDLSVDVTWGSLSQTRAFSRWSARSGGTSRTRSPFNPTICMISPGLFNWWDTVRSVSSMSSRCASALDIDGAARTGVAAAPLAASRTSADSLGRPLSP